MHLHTQFTNGIFVYYVILWGNFINNVFILGIIEKKKINIHYELVMSQSH